MRALRWFEMCRHTQLMRNGIGKQWPDSWNWEYVHVVGWWTIGEIVGMHSSLVRWSESSMHRWVRWLESSGGLNSLSWSISTANLLRALFLQIYILLSTAQASNEYLYMPPMIKLIPRESKEGRLQEKCKSFRAKGGEEVLLWAVSSFPGFVDTYQGQLSVRVL